jgi:hypothetical protein
MGRATIPQIIPNLNTVLGIIVSNIQKDESIRTKAIAQKRLCLLMDNNDDKLIT